MRRIAATLIALLLAAPAFAQDLINPQTNATALTTGTLPAGRMPALTGDCTTSAGAVATTCTKTSGTAFGAYATIGAGMLTNSIGSNVSLNNTGTCFDGPSVAQGSTGTWFAAGQITAKSTSADNIIARLYDGTTTIDSGAATSSVNGYVTIHLSGFITSPAGNVRICAKDAGSTAGTMTFNDTGFNKDSTVTVFRIN